LKPTYLQVLSLIEAYLSPKFWVQSSLLVSNIFVLSKTICLKLKFCEINRNQLISKFWVFSKPTCLQVLSSVEPTCLQFLSFIHKDLSPSPEFNWSLLVSQVLSLIEAYSSPKFWVQSSLLVSNIFVLSKTICLKLKFCEINRNQLISKFWVFSKPTCLQVLSSVEPTCLQFLSFIHKDLSPSPEFNWSLLVSKFWV
jgi:dimeric dUTPase (all-alpha-NTP-PPase superfamily)